jgi:hypothetical protein
MASTMPTAIDESLATCAWVRGVVGEARATHGRVRETRTRSASVRRDAVALVVRGMTLRGMRGLTGGSDGPEVETSLAGIVSTILLEQPACLACLAIKTERPKVEIVRVLGRMAGTIQISVDRREPCGACGNGGPVYSLKRA